jgi:peroxiredoxin
MMRSYVLTLVGAVVLLAAGDYSNRRAPGFSLADSHYQQHDPQDYRGKVLIVDIMSTQCMTCLKLAEMLVAVKAKFGDRIGILSVVTLPDNQGTADRFAKDYKVTWPIVFDSGQMITSYLRVTPTNPQVHFPHLFLIDGEGMIRNDFDGTEDKLMSVESLSAEVEKLLKKP